MARFDRILCPVDKSDFSVRALQYAVALQQSYRAELTVLTVRPREIPPALWTEYPVAPPINPMDPEVEEAELRGFIHQAVGAALAKVSVREGFVSQEILQAARETPADLIVMGTHGASGFERWLLGSVAENVLRHAACPALTVPPSAAEPPDASGRTVQDDPVRDRLFARFAARARRCPGPRACRRGASRGRTCARALGRREPGVDGAFQRRRVPPHARAGRTPAARGASAARDPGRVQHERDPGRGQGISRSTPRGDLP